MKKIIKLGLILGIYASVSCCLLAVVNSFTAPVIEKLEIEKEQNALKLVLSSASNYFPADAAEIEDAVSKCGQEIGSITINKIFKAVDADGNTIGYAANITGPTFEKSTILMGMDSQMMITGVNILKTTDTPGAQKLADYKTSKVTTGKSWAGQFEGVYPLESFETNKDYEVISGATISSGGIAAMIKAGSAVIKSYAETKN
ncbi:FMN-binding protein [Treponema sp.]|uniref:FMN-binding protein n=1 Tax=Treponema sp. TaxID=166 RepID=UPI00298E32DC|nr:FMN-binding protein [Treponema sp.]MCR5613114.1 FMN-binding protein [Treponema sp.]